MIIHEMEQRSPEWHQIRTGKITASDIPTVANGKKQTKETLCRKLAAERLTGVSTDSGFVNDSILRGIELEAEARQAFSGETGSHVYEVGFCESEKYKGWFGFSPDGLIGMDSGIEIKCPDIHTHLDYLLNGLGNNYRWQIQTALFVTGYSEWWFASYCPPFGENALFIELVKRDEELVRQIEDGVSGMILDVEKVIEAVNQINAAQNVKNVKES